MHVYTGADNPGPLLLNGGGQVPIVFKVTDIVMVSGTLNTGRDRFYTVRGTLPLEPVPVSASVFLKTISSIRDLGLRSTNQHCSGGQIQQLDGSTAGTMGLASPPFHQIGLAETADGAPSQGTAIPLAG